MKASELAGFFSAHAIWTVSQGAALTPIYAFIDGNDEQQMQRLALESLEDAVAYGKKKLENPEPGTKSQVLIVDGRITWNSEKLDALIVEMRSLDTDCTKIMLAVPYTPALKGGFLKKSRPFAVHKPKLMELPEAWKERASEFLDSFFAGAAQHEEGDAVWLKHLDESK